MPAIRHLASGLLALLAAGTSSLADVGILSDYDAWNAGDYGLVPNQTYMSTNIRGPLFQVNIWNQSASGMDRYLFLSSAVGEQPSSPLIVDTKDLSLVYAQPEFESSNNPRIQYFNDEPYLTFWHGKDSKGHGLGFCVMYDSKYQLRYNISTVRANTLADSHECQLTHDGTALITAYERKPWNLTTVPGGGPEDGLLLDSVFEEIDIATGESRFIWRASDHFGLDETGIGYGDEDYGLVTEEVGWDFFHINSLQKTREGNFLVSGRRLKTLTYINGTDGSKIWQVGGKNNDFLDLSGGAATDFGFQHTARFTDDSMTDITFFDNHWLYAGLTPGCSEGCSRGMHIRLNYEYMTAKVVNEYYHPLGFLSWAEGGFQKLDNGNALIGWGTCPVITEYTEDGQVVFDVQLGPWEDAMTNVQPVYRAWTMNWTATPTWNPDVAAHDKVAYVSWNGATEVDSWDLVSWPVPSPGTLTSKPRRSS